MVKFTDEEAAQALVAVLGDSPWAVVAMAHGYLAQLRGEDDEIAARMVYERSRQTLRASREFIARVGEEGFVALLPERVRRGSAENPVTKLFPATITEQRFIEVMDQLTGDRGGVSYLDQRECGHSYVDFVLREGDDDVPVNVKNAGIRFENAQSLVGIAPDDCIPIPAYKAHGAVSDVPNLIYVVSVDYELVGHLGRLLPALFTRDEAITWQILNQCTGSKVREAEDRFIFGMVRKNWGELKQVAADNPFHVLSARKAIRILNTQPKRTPGIGMRAWGTGASAEVNVHVSILEDTKRWEEIHRRIAQKGLSDVVAAVNRRKLEMVYDPEI